MNRVDATTSPTGMKMEAPLIDFMQDALSSAILGLAKSLGISNAILQGVEITGSTASDGWILYNGEVYKFNGGTVQTNFVISNTAVSTSNQDGSSVPRYYTREASFGSGGGAVGFNLLKRLTPLRSLLTAVNSGFGFGQLDYVSPEWVVLAGLKPNGSSTSISAGVAMYKGEVVSIASHTPGFTVSAGNPIYYSFEDGWTTTADAAHLKFDPDTPERIERYGRNAQYPLGSVLWFKSGVSFLTDKFSSGLGVGEWTDWAIADGTNGTLDLSSAISGLVAVERIV